MSEQLQQALKNLHAVEEINHKAIMAAYVALGVAAKHDLEDRMPEVPDDDTMASLGRFGEAK